MHSSTGNVAHGKSAVRYAPAVSLSLFHILLSLPFLPVSDIVELDVSVRRVSGHVNPPGPRFQEAGASKRSSQPSLLRVIPFPGCG